MKRINFILAVLLVCISTVNLLAQQQAQFTQYMFNGLALNPAYAGTQGALSTTFVARQQWTNIDGAPRNLTFSAHAPILNNRIGIGIQVLSDEIGANSDLSANAVGSYQLPVSEKGTLSFGLQIGLDALETDYSDLQLGAIADPNFSGGGINEGKPNVGAGLYYYTDRTFVGLSAPRLIENSFQSTTDAENEFLQQRHLLLYAGHVIDLTPNLKFKPNILLRGVSGAPVNIDLNANFLFIERIWAGISWRTFDSIDLLAQYLITEQFSVGYSVDFTHTSLGNGSGLSHEFVLNYLFNFRKKSMLTPRYF